MLITHTHDQEDEEQIILETLPSGTLVFRSQLTDYKLRGHELDNMSLVSFVVDTRDDSYIPTASNQPTQQAGPGAPRHPRSSYLPEHPRSKTHQRVLRAPDHNVLPNIVGPYLPRSDDEDTYGFYCCSMLALLKPWRDIRDLAPAGQPWHIAFATFLLSAKPRDLDFISGAQYYYQCKDAAAHERQNQPLHQTFPNELGADGDVLGDLPDKITLTEPPPQTESELEERLARQQNAREVDHGREAVDIARRAGLFASPIGQSQVADDGTVCTATAADIANITAWQTAMEDDSLSRKTASGSARTDDVPTAAQTVESLDHMNADSTASTSDHGRVIPEPAVEEEIRRVDVSFLTSDQLRAFSIIEAHLHDTIAKNAPKQLLMQIQGEGGTGKSTVIGCVTQLFQKKNLEHKLVRSAYTGIAASLIDGNTLHTLCRLTQKRELSDETIEALRKTWRDVEYLIIDEISMVSREFLFRVSSILDAAKQPGEQPVNGRAFGGLNVILTGDFHQFPPVACGPSAPLYCPGAPLDRREACTGRKIYRRFRTVVVLREQCRTTDPEWLDVLRHVRHGTCTNKHLEIIRSIDLGANTTDGGPTVGAEWEDAVLVTPRHAVREAWNASAVRRHCAKHNKTLYICPAEDTIKGRPLTILERWRAGNKKTRSKADRGRRLQGKLPDRIELAVGMEVMVTYNVDTNLDVANGARGVVEKIILDRRETRTRSNNANPEVKLTYPPECVLVRLYRTKAAQLPGLDPGVIPIVPMERKFDLPVGKGKTRRATRRQLPITAAYAFTDYRSQGQTIKRVIVDIARPPSGGLTPFNAYVALSRSTGRNSIRLLRGFDEGLFKQPPSFSLEAEDMWLEERNKATKRRWEAGERVWDDDGFVSASDVNP